MNGYATFLNEKSELPRLSILDNYKQIMRIMTNSFNKGREYQNKFKNRMEKDIINDEEYQKFKEEENNTKKMSTILKSLNHPVIRRSKLSANAATRSSVARVAGQNSIHGTQVFNKNTNESVNSKDGLRSKNSQIRVPEIDENDLNIVQEPEI